MTKHEPNPATAALRHQVTGAIERGDAEPVVELPACLDAHKGGCEGEVEYRMPLSGTGRAFPRCDHHWDLRLREQERINRTYPQTAPSDFDPSYAGESWDED